MHAAAEQIEEAASRIGESIADRFSFDGDLADNLQSRQRKNGGALIAPVGDEEPQAAAIGAQRQQFLRRCDVRRIQHDLSLHRPFFRIDGHDGLWFGEAHIDRAVGAERQAVWIAGQCPAFDDLRIR